MGHTPMGGQASDQASASVSRTGADSERTDMSLVGQPMLWPGATPIRVMVLGQRFDAGLCSGHARRCQFQSGLSAQRWAGFEVSQSVLERAGIR